MKGNDIGHLVAAEMGLVVKQIWADPRYGQRTVELKYLSRVDPDTALFRPPSGFAAKDAVESLKELEQQLEAGQQ